MGVPYYDYSIIYPAPYSDYSGRYIKEDVSVQVEMCERVEYSWRSELGLSSDCQASEGTTRVVL